MVLYPEISMTDMLIIIEEDDKWYGFQGCCADLNL